MVFYNRMMRCFVLFDLKIGTLKHQDLGQMQMYVNYYDRYEKLYLPDKKLLQEKLGEWVKESGNAE